MCKSSKPLHLIYFSGPLDLRKGGPAGYLANLKLGLEEIEKPRDFIVSFLVSEKQFDEEKKKIGFSRKIREKILSNRKVRSVYVNYIGKSRRRRAQERVRHLQELCSGALINDKVKEFVLKNKNLKSIHCHTVFDAAEVLNTLDFIGVRGKVRVILTSHAPESVSIELSNILMESGLSDKYVRPFIDACDRVQEKVFREVDALIFPSAEAMEPYYQTIPGFDEIIADKKVLFLLTGTIGLKGGMTREEARAKLAIPNDTFVVSFVGRHNAVKGYDLLCGAASKVFETRCPICVVVGGVESDCFTPPSDPRWRELGWVDPTTVLIASDLFVLPNRRTYFDLIMLEALSVGANVLATNTGGNKTIFNLTKCVTLVEADSDAIAHAIIEQMKNPAMRKKAALVKERFSKFFDEKKFALNYLSLVFGYLSEENLL